MKIIVSIYYPKVLHHIFHLLLKKGVIFDEVEDGSIHEVS